MWGGTGESEAQRVNSGEVGSELDLGDAASTPASNATHKATKDGDPALAIAGTTSFILVALG